MKNATYVAIFSLVLLTAATAQDAPSPEMRSYQIRMNNEINANLQCTATVLTLQDRIKALETELAKLKTPDK